MGPRRWRACLAPTLAGLLAAVSGLALASAAHAETIWIGPRVSADALANTPIGGPFGTTLAFRFRAAWSGSITSVRLYVVVNSDGTLGYSGGDGGILGVSVVPQGEDGLPSETVLGSATLRPRMDAISFPRLQFDTPPEVVAGHDYALVFTNLSPQPEVNYVSINALVARGLGVPPPPFPLADGVLLGDSKDGGGTPANWRARAQGSGENYLPIVDISGNKRHMGLGYMESWISNPKPIDPGASVRELFTYTRSRPARLVEALVRVRRTGDWVGPLSIRLENPEGTVLAVAKVPGALVPADGAGWVSAIFRKPPLLVRGETVALVLRSAGATFEAYPLRKGLAFGFDSGTFFGSGYAQFSRSRSGSWKGWDQWGDTNRKDGDLQFALRLRS
jgi:hypothetical protein